jgi:Uma2 family endonuclease
VATDPRWQNSFWLGADLALEVVSDEKPERDLVDKRIDSPRPLFWNTGSSIRERRSLLLFDSKEKPIYQEAGSFRRGQAVSSVQLPEFSLPVDAVFDAP